MLKFGLDVQQSGFRILFLVVDYLSQTYAAQQSVTKFIAIIVVNLTTLKTAAKLHHVDDQMSFYTKEFILSNMVFKYKV